MTARTSFISALVCLSLLVLVGSCDNQAKPSDAVQAQQATAEPASDTPNTGNAQQQQTPPQPAHAADPAATIPEFTFYILRSGIRFTKADLAKKGNIVFILFDPTCGHCQHEASDIGKHYEEIKDVNLYFVSMNDPALMSTFLEKWAKPLVGKTNVEVLYDRNAEFINKFHVPSQYPATYVYGTDSRLKTFWNGERPTREVIDGLKN